MIQRMVYHLGSLLEVDDSELIRGGLRLHEILLFHFGHDIQMLRIFLLVLQI